MGKDYLGKDQRKTVDEKEDDKPIRGERLSRNDSVIAPSLSSV